ncbi:MAG: hypothetical protein KDA25_10435, partial [Phycisphaerales bacterium]|nr:hypothetical protein [Phycisphaerales bacterium]
MPARATHHALAALIGAAIACGVASRPATAEVPWIGPGVGRLHDPAHWPPDSTLTGAVVVFDRIDQPHLAIHVDDALDVAALVIGDAFVHLS